MMMVMVMMMQYPDEKCMKRNAENAFKTNDIFVIVFVTGSDALAMLP